MEENPRPLKLLKKLHNIMTAVDPVLKSGYNEKQNYNYAQEADVLKAIREQLIKQKIVILPSTLKSSAVEMGWGILTSLSVSYMIYDTESGEVLSMEFDGQGMDGGDKGIYKAYTGANKYFLLKTFQIPTEDDPENDKGSSSPAKKKYNPKVQNKNDGSIERRMKSKYGTTDKPNKCGFCNNLHVVTGDNIVLCNGKWGIEACLSADPDSQLPPEPEY